MKAYSLIYLAIVVIAAYVGTLLAYSLGGIVYRGMVLVGFVWSWVLLCEAWKGDSHSNRGSL